jgi:dihydrofolate reductase
MEIIYAIDSNNGLCKNGTIPWRSKKDMSFFMNKTKNNVVIMGKNTFFSIPDENRPLKNRLNIVLTSDPQLYDSSGTPEYSNVLFTNNANTYQDILQNRDQYSDKYRFLKNDFKIFCIGGKTIYEQFIPLCDRFWVTYIKRDYNCDLFIDYDYSIDFLLETHYEDDELRIVEYNRVQDFSEN